MGMPQKALIITENLVTLEMIMGLILVRATGNRETPPK